MTIPEKSYLLISNFALKIGNAELQEAANLLY